MNDICITLFSGEREYKYVPFGDESVEISCSIELINKKIENEEIDSLDFYLMELFGKYKFLNYNLIKKVVSSEFIEISEKQLKTRLSKFRKFGFVGMYFNGVTNVYVSSEGINIYYMLKKGKKYSRKSKEFSSTIDAKEVNKILPVNTFLINCINDSRCSISESYDVDIRYIKLRETGYHVSIMALRKNDDLENVLHFQLEAASKRFNRKMVFILICEGYKHMIDVNRILSNDSYLKGKFFYTCDRNVSISPLDNVFKADSKNIDKIRHCFIK